MEPQGIRHHLPKESSLPPDRGHQASLKLHGIPQKHTHTHKSIPKESERADNLTKLPGILKNLQESMEKSDHNVDHFSKTAG